MDHPDYFPPRLDVRLATPLARFQGSVVDPVDLLLAPADGSRIIPRSRTMDENSFAITGRVGHQSFTRSAISSPKQVGWQSFNARRQRKEEDVQVCKIKQLGRVK